MDDAEYELTDADRRTIAAIRRKLDEEFRQKLDAEFGPLEDGEARSPESPSRLRRDAAIRQASTRTRRATDGARHRARRRSVVATLLVGIVAGTALGVTGMLLWGRSSDRAQVRVDATAPRQDAEPTTAAAPAPPVEEPTIAPAPAPRVAEPATAGASAPPDAADEIASLRGALDEWIEATGRGDITTQMRFYPERVAVYYTWRNVSREAVRAEKMKVFGAASRLVITTDVPAVEIAEDGASAVTRFRKRYIIESPRVRRRGEVLQELRWARTSDGWLIVGERDAGVLRSG